MTIPSLVEMLKSGVHFGHQTSRWHPKMKKYIFTNRNGLHIIDLQKTQKELQITLDAVKQMTSEGKQILFATTKPQAKEIMRKAAIDAGMPYIVNRWIGGMLTNFPEIKKLLDNYISLKEQQASGELEKYTKKEQLDIAKDLEKKDQTISGLTSLKKIPDAIFVASLQGEKTALIEANKKHVTVIGIADTNANPTKANYVIPANDDAIKSIEMMVTAVAQAAKEGRQEYLKKHDVAGKKDASQDKQVDQKKSAKKDDKADKKDTK